RLCTDASGYAPVVTRELATLPSIHYEICRGFLVDRSIRRKVERRRVIADDLDRDAPSIRCRYGMGRIIRMGEWSATGGDNNRDTAHCSDPCLSALWPSCARKAASRSAFCACMA